MAFRTLAKAAVLLALLSGASWPAAGQTAEQPRKGFTSLLNVDALIDNYLRFLTKKYDLTEEQTAFTEQLVRQKVDDFLGRHQGELNELIDRLFEVRGGAEISQEELMRWGRRVLPIYNEAKTVIIQSNAEWRETLSEAQRAVHDEDLKLMHESFLTTEDQLQRIVTGQMSIEEFRNPRRVKPSQTPAGERSGPPPSGNPPPGPTVRTPPPPTPDSPPGVRPDGHRSPLPGTSGERVGKPRSPRDLPRSPEGGRVVRPGEGRTDASRVPRPMDERSTRPGRGPERPGAAAGNDFESQWETYVRQFIERYQLNEEQQARAYKILRSCQQAAARYLASRQAEFERLDRRTAELKDAKDKDKLKELSEIAETRKKLREPIEKILEGSLKPRLERLPTRAQREAAEKGPKKPPVGPTVPRGDAGSSGSPPVVPPPPPPPPEGGG